jgi:hypothetical protein
MSRFVVLAIPILLLSVVANGTQLWKKILYIIFNYSSDLNTYIIQKNFLYSVNSCTCSWISIVTEKANVNRNVR